MKQIKISIGYSEETQSMFVGVKTDKGIEEDFSEYKITLEDAKTRQKELQAIADSLHVDGVIYSKTKGIEFKIERIGDRGEVYFYGGGINHFMNLYPYIEDGEWIVRNY